MALYVPPERDQAGVVTIVFGIAGQRRLILIYRGHDFVTCVSGASK